jgi:hypothetical protein
VIITGAGDLRDRVWFERREALDPDGPGDGAGNYEGEYKPICSSRRAALLPSTGGDKVIADRLQGTAAYDLWVRSDSGTRKVKAGDKVVDARNPQREFTVRSSLDLANRRRWLVMQVEQGVAT